MIFAGIDPGVTGALVLLTETSGVLYAEPLPVLPYRNTRRQVNCRELHSRLSALREPGIESIVTIEDVHAFPKQGVSSTFSFGMSFGQSLGVIESLGLRHQLVTPQRWQKLLFAGMKGEPKQLAQLAAHRLWPGNTFKHGGILDALLIAEYGRRTWTAQPEAAR